MIGRMQIVLLTTLPTGAALLYLLWMYHRRRTSVRSIDSKRHAKTPAIEVTSADDECTKQVDEKQSEVLLCGEWKSSLESSMDDAAGKFVSSSCGGEVTSDCFEEQFQVASQLGCALPTSFEPKNGLKVGPIHADMSMSFSVDTSKTTESYDMTSSQQTSNSVNSSMCDKADTMDDSDDIRVHTTVLPHDEDFMTNGVVMTNGVSTGDSEEDGSWGNCVPEIVDDEVMCNGIGETPLIMDSCGNIRKDSLGSMSDANSCDSRDRNANQRTTAIVTKEKKNRRGSTSKSEKTLISHAFDFPTELCGRLIGQRGRNIAMIKEKSGAEIFIKSKLYDIDWQIVRLEGSRQQVNKALDLIRRKFPLKRFPAIDYNRSTPDAPVVPAELMRLILPYGVPVEVVVSHVISPNHIFVQQPTHPTFPLLERQTYNMRACYGVDNVPVLPRPIEVGMICAAPLSGDWFRAQVVQSSSDADEYDLKLIDYGGYVHLPGSCLRQIRSDFMSVPFQAIECYLANVIPPTDDEEFPVTAKSAMEELVKGCILQCDVIGVEMDGVQYVVLTKLNGSERQIVSRELVNCGVARWLEM